MFYYRSDLIKPPPATWDEYVAMAQQFQGKDLNGDGQGDYGSCIAFKRGAQSYWFITSISSAYLQNQGTGPGAFFYTTNMNPLVNNDPFFAGFDVFKQLSPPPPPDPLNHDVL